MHKGRTTQAPWDPALVQKAFATSPASQAISAEYCNRNLPHDVLSAREPDEAARQVWGQPLGGVYRGAVGWCGDLVIILGQGREKGRERRDVVLVDGHPTELQRRIAKLPQPSELRARDIELDDVGKLQLAAVVKIWRRVLEIAERGCLELRDGSGQALIGRAILNVRADDGREIRLRIRHIGIQVNVPKSEVGELRAAGDGGMTEALTGVRMICRCGQVGVVIRGARGERGNRERGKGARSVGRVVFLLRDARIVEAKVGEIGRCMAGGAVSGVLRAVGRPVCDVEKDFQTREFGRAEYKWLRVKLKVTQRPVNEPGMGKHSYCLGEPLR